jgi:aryl-alcohol dehydrogenase-like predicted oxidoreductase
MTWGRDTPVTAAVAMIKRFLDAGGDLIDTAAAYGNGEVESLLGRMMKRTIKRSDLFLATKSGYVPRDGHRVIDMRKPTLLADLEGSLRRLGTDYVDLWQLHAWGETPIEETLEAADEATQRGLARHVGVSNYVGWQLAQAITWQRQSPDRAPSLSAQVEYSLLARRAELEILPCADALNIGVFPWSPLGRGVLTGKYRDQIPPDSRGASSHFDWFVKPYLTMPYRRLVEGIIRAGEGLNLTCAQVALLWVRDAPGVTAPIIGPRTPDQLEPLLEIDHTSLPPIIAEALDDISGGPNHRRPPSQDASAA